MHADTFETPEQGQTQSTERLDERVKQWSSEDRDYFRSRAIEEDDAAARASSCEARFAHKELAAAYRQLCRFNGYQRDPHLASERAMFRSNP